MHDIATKCRRDYTFSQNNFLKRKKHVMHKKTTKTHRLTNKQPSGESRSARMTILKRRASGYKIHARLDIISKSCSSTCWDYRINQSSWSEEIESMASHKILEQWRIIDRTLFDEEDQLTLGILFDECLQWRNQLTHLRILGKRIFSLKDEVKTRTITSSKGNSTTKRRDRSAKKNNEESKILCYKCDYHSKELSTYSPNEKNQTQFKEVVLDVIVDYICKELSEIETKKEAEDLSNNFDKFLKILPAPTYIGKNPLVSSNFYFNTEKINIFKMKEKEQMKKQELEVGRNKLGTIFNKKIIVSSVPFISTTRESFSTLRRNPIHFLEENDVSSNFCSGLKQQNTKENLSLTRKMPLIAGPHIQSWNFPVCPTIWPKNIKLTPIDITRLPSSKRRPTKTAESLPSRRSRYSLSPILRSVQSNFHKYVNNDLQHSNLEIRGSQITTHVPELENKTARENLAYVKSAKE